MLLRIIFSLSKILILIFPDFFANGQFARPKIFLENQEMQIQVLFYILFFHLNINYINKKKYEKTKTDDQKFYNVTI